MADGSFDAGRAKTPLTGRRPLARMVWLLLRRYPRRAAISAVALFGTGLLNAIGIAALLPLMAFALGDRAAGAAPSPIELAFQSVFGFVGLTPTVEGMLGLVVLVMIAKAGLNVLAMRHVSYAAAAVAADARLQLVNAWMAARWDQYLALRTGTLSNSIALEAQRIGSVYNTSAKAAAELAQAAIYLGLALMVSWQVTLASIAVAGAIVALLWGLMRRTRSVGRENTKQMGSFTARLVEGLRAMKTLKALSAEDRIGPLLEKEVRDLEKSGRALTALTHYLRVLQEPLTVVALAVGIYLLLEVWEQPLESLVILTVLFTRTVGSINAMQGSVQNLFSFEGAFWHVQGLIGQGSNARESDQFPTVVPKFEREVSLKAVSFTYGDTPILTNVSLSIPFGSFVAITGPSGSGKTTTADLIVRLFDPTSGSIEVDGIAIDRVGLKQWRRLIGYVPQESVLFHDTLLTNVTLGSPEMGRDQAIEALRAAEAWGFVEQLPQGIDTVLGEQGARLSGGQRQRIAIARALVRKPRLLILDEATTALDPTTEAEIVATLSRLSGSITVFAVSHQPKIVEAADNVYRLEAGVLVLTREGRGPAKRAVSDAR